MSIKKIFKKLHNCKYYFTHDNGGRPFCIYIDEIKNIVYIYKKKVDSNIYDDLIASYNPIKVFIGKSPLIPMTEFSGGHGTKFDGNAILLKINTNQYIYIGISIYSFTSESEIVSFVSPMGNNDVPYTYAIDIEENYYFLVDHNNFIDNGILKIDDVSQYNDPYDYYYFIKENISKVENIEWLYMGNEIYYFESSSYPLEKYDNLIKRLGDKGPMYIQYKGKEKQLISKSEYVSVLENYNKKVGLKPISNINVIQDRLW